MLANKPQVGLGLRLEFLAKLQEQVRPDINFLELAPENWIGVGGWRQKALQQLAVQYPIICHGLSLSIGGPQPLDPNFLQQIKAFLAQYEVSIYSEHLSYCSDRGQLYDLLPLPFTEEAVNYVVQRVKQVQHVLEQQLVLENVSYYCPMGGDLTELEFIQAVLVQADCKLLLDVNNVYVNSVNHCYDPQQFIKALDSRRIAYIHIAGHEQIEKDLIIDTHGASIIQPVWDLLVTTYQQHGILPTLLERDNVIPSLDELVKEIIMIHDIQAKIKCAAA